ncbi:pancreatic lipase-related protein 2-like [Sphaerodactylus townsendi]|uniref:pancreatic lipase-related protein 2-like n=1 Tax=Sphaerodactylus townsendi TaxID=933632 RepID=UPI002026C672|nr:pancreatic lipase-related protein 2-like [Sphaerodactylus townsendi]
MNISFFLFTKKSRNTSQKISARNTSTIEKSYFSPSRKTAFVIHGFASTGRKGWVVEMCLLLVDVENINCIAVDWKEGAKGTYFVAASNIRVLGAEIAYLISTIKKLYKYSLSKVHLIGHSLGAHTAGETGRRFRGVNQQISGIGRISGLDPAGLCFEGMPIKVRLDPSDAVFVDVIHSNAGKSLIIGLGMYNSTGDIDFYPNGGTNMVGCGDHIRSKEEDHPETTSSFPLAANRIVGTCHHSRSHGYFKYSIICPNGFLGYPCESYESFTEGNCFPCPKEGCPMMGYYADRFYDKLKKEDTPKYFLKTAPTEPFCNWRYNISIKLSGAARGDINIIFHGKEGNTKQYQIASGCLWNGQIYSKIIDTEINLANVTRVEFLWYKKFFTLLWAKLGAEKVTLTPGQDGHKSHFCGNGKVAYGVLQTLIPC